MRPLTVVVPVFNGRDHLSRCLEALARCAPAGARIVLNDDASTDAGVAPLLATFVASMPAARLLRADRNGGFIAACNAAVAQATPGSDLLFLNADTELTLGSIEEMAAVLEQVQAAVCCPMSSNATILSVPRYQQSNDLPPGWSAEDMARHVRTAAGAGRAARIPTPIGFCMLVRREAWDAHGPFDPAFGMGYGEEDDFGQRVQAAGGSIVAALKAYVWHKGAASFGAGEPINQQRAANGRLLLSRWPAYADNVRAFAQANPLRPMHERLWHQLLSAPEERSRHVLHLVPRWELQGPFRDHVLSVARAGRDVANHTILVPMPDRGAWLDAIDFEVERGIRVVGLIELSGNFDRFLAASPATQVRVHDKGRWDPAPWVDSVARRGLPLQLA
jgi:GT2 family glycosyltransferase